MKSYLKFLSRNKAYTVIDVLGLALSMMFIVLIGAYTWQETHIDSQHSRSSRMYVMGMDMDGDRITGSHWRMIRRLIDKFPEIEAGTALVRGKRQLETTGGENVTANVLYADSTFYDIFDFQLLRGDRSKVLSAPNSIVVTEDFARKMWKDEDPVGKTIVFQKGEDPLVVTGIMAPMENTAISTPEKTPFDAVIPFPNVRFQNESLYMEGMNNAVGADIVLLARNGADLRDKENQINEFAKEFFWILRLPGTDYRITIEPFDTLYFSDYQSINVLSRGDGNMVKILFATGLAILLFALMNYVNLTVALSGYRAREMATRRLLGHSRRGIIMKLMAESTLLCLVSFIIGFFLAWLALPYAGNLLGTSISLRHCITPATVLILIAIILLMGVLAGIIPALLISSAKPIDVVRGTFRRRTKMVFSKVFIVVQNVITIVMIAAAITMYLQINHLVNAPLGYDSEGLLSIENGGDNSQAKVFMQRVSELPSVEMVSAAAGNPFQGGNNNTMTYNDRTVSFQTLIGDENYFKILGIGLERNNGLSDRYRIYLNRQALAELGLPEDTPDYPYYSEREPVAGIMKDFHIRTILDEQHPLRAIITDIDGFTPWEFLIKVKGDEASQAETYGMVKEIFKEIYRYDIEDPHPYLRQAVEYRFKSQRNLVTIVAIFAMIAIVVSLLGLVAMSTYFVQQRRREIAIKKVFGCGSSEMLRRLVLSFLSYVAIAFVLAVPLIYWLMNDWLSEFSYRIPLHWWIFVISGAVCMVISVISVYIQSSRAANENPVRALYQN